jgi:hypothetical protein
MHRGCTIFSVLYKEFSQIHTENERQKRYESASHHTMDDVEKMELELELVLPRDYDGVLKALQNYEKLLAETIGGECHHWTWVKKLIKVYKAGKEALEQIIDLKKGLILLWNVHVDSRDFFFQCIKWSDGEDLPRSKLKNTVTHLEDERVCQKDTMPMEAILKRYAPWHSQSFTSSEVDAWSPGKGTKITKPAQKLQRNNKIPAAVKPILAKLRAKVPGVCFATHAELGVPGCDYRGLTVGPKGSCIDYGLFGFCPNHSSCRYDHNVVNPSEGKTKKIVQNLEKGLEALSG